MLSEGTIAAHRLLRLSYIGFVSLGLPDTVLGAAWPALRRDLGLPLDAAGLILLVTTGGVVLSSVSSSALRRRFGTGMVLAGSTLLAAIALAMSALAHHGSILLGAALIAGLGGGAIDAALNEYVARHYEARHLTWLHACWGIGAAIAPMVVAAALASGTSWRWAYGALASAELCLGASFVVTRQLWTNLAEARAQRDSITQRGAVRWPMIASVLLFFCYGGLEAGTGLWSTSYLIGTRGVPVALAGVMVGLFWGALTLGRILGGLRADALGPARVVRFASYGALLACGALALPQGPAWFAGIALSLLGLALAPIYPLVMHDTPSRFEASWGTRLVGYQVAAASLGVATLPGLLGIIAERTSLAMLPLLLGALASSVVALQYARKG